MQPIHSPSKKKRRFRLWWIFLWLGFVGLLFWWWLQSSFYVNTTVDLQQGQSFGAFLTQLSSRDARKVKVYVKTNAVDLSGLEQGVYEFDGHYSPKQFVDHVLAWVEPEYVSFTALEWWSVYDIDESLAAKWMILPWEFLRYVNNQEKIRQLSSSYTFLSTIGGDALVSLEGFLYPDTYFLDEKKPIIQQLVTLQLNAFEQKIWDTYQEDFDNFDHYKKTKWFSDVELSFYDIMILATVVEKEERTKKNKPIIAWLFMNRLQRGDRIDADITLCYWLEQSYEWCTPSTIVKHLYDDKNPYNTRAVHGLPPTAIANPTSSSIMAVLNFTKTKYLFYLHDPTGRIHFWETISEHNANKSKYLN